MSCKLILHLGDHKTGSTSIQKVLSTGGIQAEQNLFFPMDRPEGLRLNQVARTMVRTEKQPKRLKLEQQYFEDLATKIRGSKADIAVISAETFEVSDPAVLKEALATYLPEFVEEARLIAYVRPHGERMLSSFAERTKQGLFLGDLPAFHAETLEEGEFAYAPRLEAWRAAFGERFTTRPFLRETLKDGDVVTDFFDWVLEGAAFSVTAPAHTNEKLSVEDLAVLRELQRRLEDVSALKSTPRPRAPVRALGWRMARMLSSSAGDRGTPLALDRAIVAVLQEAYGADAAAVDAAFFDGTPMSQALNSLTDKAVDAPQPIELADVVSPETYRIALGWMQVIHDLYILRPADWLSYFQANPLRPEGLAKLDSKDSIFPGLETEIEDLGLDWDDDDADED